MQKNIVLLFLLCSCASMFITKSDLHLFYGANKDYFKYDPMKKDNTVQFYTALLKNNLTFNVTNQMQENEIFRKVKLEDFQSFESDENLAGAVQLIKTFHLYHSRQEFSDELEKLASMKVNFQVAQLNEVFRKAVEKSGYWSKKYYLNILGRFADAPIIHYKAFTKTFLTMKQKNQITSEQLDKIGQSFLDTAKKDKYMDFDITEIAFGYNLKRISFPESCKSSECKKVKEQRKIAFKKVEKRTYIKDDALKKMSKFLEKNAQLLKNEIAFFKELDTNKEFAKTYYDLVTPLWFVE